MHRDGRPTPVPELEADLARYLAAARVDAAAAERARERWLRQAAGEEALLAGVLLDLAERGATVVVRGPGGRTHRGRVRAVGQDFIALRGGSTDVLLPTWAMGSVRAEGPVATGVDRAHALDLTLAEALATVAGERPRVLVVDRDGAGVAGLLHTVGRDVLTLRLPEPGAAAYVPLASVAAVTVVG